MSNLKEMMDTATVLAFCEDHGHGRMIQIIQEDWSKKLQQEWAMAKPAADAAAGMVCAWCNIDHRTGKKVK
jgi:hypothetical protein